MPRDLDRWLPAIQQGDTDAFAAWMAHAEPALRPGLRRFAAQVDTEVVLQEALARAWTFSRRVQPDGKPDALLRYTARTARNLAIDHARARARERAVALDDVEEPAVEPAPPDPHLAAHLNRCLSRLPAQPRAALNARLDACAPAPDRDLAQGIGMSLNTFLQNIGRARRLLVDCLRAAGIEPDEHLQGTRP